MIFPGHELIARMPITGRKRPGRYIGWAPGWRIPASIIQIGESKIELPNYCLEFREIGPVNKKVLSCSRVNNIVVTQVLN